MNAVLTITRGLPGSGKSTWARTQPAVRVNRDDLRSMLVAVWPHGDRAHEDLCTLVQLAAIDALLRAGVDVTCDDTNMRSSSLATLSAVAFDAGAGVLLRDFTDVPVDVCVARDAARACPVGEDVIRHMWAEYLLDQRTGRETR